MLMKLMLLAAATAAAVSATTGVATNTVSANSRNKKREAFPGEILELPEHRAVFMDDPTAKTYRMDYMYV